MSAKMNRRELLKGSLASMAGLAALGIPLSAMPALAQDETLVPFRRTSIQTRDRAVVSSTHAPSTISSRPRINTIRSSTTASPLLTWPPTGCA